jgi:carbonic anhydrase/acetyltransferase-like protein (isoleucine patch superfamily)
MSENPANVDLGNDVYLAPSAYVGGAVTLGNHCTVMHHAVIRGDVASIRLGDRSNVQDGAILHTRYGVPLDIAEDVVIAHRAVVHCRSVGPRTMIGIGAIVLDNARVGENCIVAAGAVVIPGTQIPNGTLVVGVPAKPLRETTAADREEIARIVKVYVELGKRHGKGDFPNAVAKKMSGDKRQ